MSPPPLHNPPNLPPTARAKGRIGLQDAFFPRRTLQPAGFARDEPGDFESHRGVD